MRVTLLALLVFATGCTTPRPPASTGAMSNIPAMDAADALRSLEAELLEAVSVHLGFFHITAMGTFETDLKGGLMLDVDDRTYSTPQTHLFALGTFGGESVRSEGKRSAFGCAHQTV